MIFSSIVMLNEMIPMGLVLDSVLKHSKQMHGDSLSKTSTPRELIFHLYAIGLCW